ncbi:MAG: S-methyl-5-thioribose-1-phosphate isomerase [Candidatus Neomarinimicrobiota bacterium]
MEGVALNLVHNGVVRHLQWQGNSLRFLDQTLLPNKVEFVETSDYQVVCDAIRRLAIRGAPAIGVAAGYAFALGAQSIKADSQSVLAEKLRGMRREIESSRPTAVNLSWALKRMVRILERSRTVQESVKLLIREAENIHVEDIDMCKTLGQLGKKLIPEEGSVMTYCNAGGLATGGYGTALGVIHSAFSSMTDGGRTGGFKVIVNETRPLLQGARLTAWELREADIPFILITDNMAAHTFAHKMVTCVIVGADRIALNGDTANKIGTYNLAVLAKYHGIPFYVAAPTSTVDAGIESGRDIPIEHRGEEEITHIAGHQTAPPGTSVTNPAFDVTPSNLISAIITEKAICEAPYRDSFERIL